MATNAFRINGVGDCAISLALTSQLLKPSKISATFYGLSGDDTDASSLRHSLAQTPLDISGFRQRPGSSQEIIRFMEASILGDEFFQATLNIYADIGTYPKLKEELIPLCKKGRHRGALNIVISMKEMQDAFDPSMDLFISSLQALQNFFPTFTFSKMVDQVFSKGLTALLIRLSDSEYYFHSIGGIFGKCQGKVNEKTFLNLIEREPSKGNVNLTASGDTFLAGFFTNLLLQIHADDFYPKGEVHIERELLQICPLRFHQAIGWGLASQNCFANLSTPIIKETERGQRFVAVQKKADELMPVGIPWN